MSLKEKIESLKEKKVFWLITGVLTALIVFVGFHVLYSADIPEYGKEFIAGCLGALITIAATAVLLKSQTDGEITKDQLSEIFQTKLALYNEFIIFINGIRKDGTITEQEKNEIIQWGLRLALVTNSMVIRYLYLYIMQLLLLGTDNLDALENDKNYENYLILLSELGILNDQDDTSNREEILEYYTGLGDIVSVLRDDLVIKKLSTEDDHLDIKEHIKDILLLSNVSSIDVEDGELVFGAATPEKKPRTRTRVERKTK